MVREVVIVYATATGTAEELAGEVYRQLYGIGVQAKVVNIKSLTTLTPKSKSTNTTGGKENPADEWYNKLYVFLVATSGQGIEPPDMRYFWHRYLLRKSLILIPDTLDTSNGRIPTHRLQYCVFGLGDSSYEFYNFAAKKLDKRLGLVGGERIGALGLGDDQHYWGVYGGFLPWVDRLREYISKNLGEYKNVHVGIDVGHGGMVPVLNRLPSEEELEKEMSTDVWNGSELDEQYYNAQVVDNKLITDQAHEFDAIRKIQLNLTVNNRKNEVAEYLPGDVIEIHPQNSDEAVVRLMERLGLVCASDQNKCMDASGWMDEAKERVIKHVLKYRVDLNAVARQTTIRMLSQFITNRGFESESESVLAMKIDKFRKLGEFQEIDEYYRYVVRPKRNILEVLEDDFGELEFDVRSVGEYLLDILHPRLVGRQYSIANYPQFSADSMVDIIVGIVKYKNNLRKKKVSGSEDDTCWIMGTCSRYVDDVGKGGQMEIGKEIVVKLVRNRVDGFKLPPAIITDGLANTDGGYRILLIATGTGISPMISIMDYIYYKYYCGSDGEKGKVKVWLIYGCRKYLTEGRYYEEEILKKRYNGQMVYDMAYSREARSELYKHKYVTDIMDEYQQQIYEEYLASSEPGSEAAFGSNSDLGYVYVCGSLKVTRSVCEKLELIKSRYKDKDKSIWDNNNKKSNNNSNTKSKNKVKRIQVESWE